MSSTPVERSVRTPVGSARTWTDRPYGLQAWSGVLVLGHGAGGGVEAPDLLAARDGALAVGMGVVRVEQPWRVQGRRIAEAPTRLDQAWLAVLADLAELAGVAGLPLVVGGRSAGARVACRTATEVGAVGVLALAFPLDPPVRKGEPHRPDRSRLPELRLPAVPRLVVQGDRDRFGLPQPEPGVEVEVVTGADHGFAVRRADGRTAPEVAAQVTAAVAGWLDRTQRAAAGQRLT